jgi:lipopolysaccharide export system permease protein
MSTIPIIECIIKSIQNSEISEENIKEYIDNHSEEFLINIDKIAIDSDSDWEKLNSYENEVLIKIVKDAKQYGYTDEYRNKALKVLESRNISQEELLLNNNLYNVDYNKVEELHKQYKILRNKFKKY